MLGLAHAAARFTIRIKRFGLFCDMVKVVQENAGYKADHKPESRLERCFKTGRHKAIMSQPRSAACYFIEPRFSAGAPRNIAGTISVE
jgi:hypothetical protein